MKIAVVILTGGEGRRIGGDKPLRRLGGERLIDRAEALSQQWSKTIALSVRDPAQADAGANKIIDERGVQGPLAGLVAALRYAKDAGCAAVLTIPADMPFLPPDLRQRLTAGLGSSRAAIAGSGGNLHPVCGLWRVSALDRVPDYLATGRRSLKGFAESIGFSVAEWPTAPIDPFFNINSAEELAEAERLLGR